MPGTGGFTRLVDKRKVRRDLADVFVTLAEGVRGKRAVQWSLVDALIPRSRFAEVVGQRVDTLVASGDSGAPRAAESCSMCSIPRQAKMRFATAI